MIRDGPQPAQGSPNGIDFIVSDGMWNKIIDILSMHMKVGICIHIIIINMVFRLISGGTRQPRDPFHFLMACSVFG